jgi:hypothetical protein
MDSLTLPWMVEIGLISYRDYQANKRPPLPSEVLSTFVIFGFFTIISVAEPKLGAALGWGIVIATALNVMPGVSSPTLVSKTTASKTAPKKAS